MISKNDLIRRMKEREQISPEVEKMTEGMVERWEKTGVKFDSQAANPEAEKQAARVLDFTHILNNKRFKI